nr:cbb3-type cytochrome c oxidase subunit I [Acidobacteriota bacterium]
VSAFFLVGGIFAMLIRLELATPRGDLMTPETYNKVFTAHGVVMVFFFLIPSIPAILGNFLVPLMIGARDLAFPRINLLSWYIYVLGGLFGIAALVSGVIRSPRGVASSSRTSIAKMPPTRKKADTAYR